MQNKAGWALRETLASQLGPRGCPETESSLPGDLTLLSLKTFSRLDETQAHGGASFIFSKSADLNVNHILKKTTFTEMTRLVFGQRIGRHSPAKWS